MFFSYLKLKNKEMKKIYTLIIAGAIGISGLYSQEVEDKVVQAGFVFSGGMLMTQFGTGQVQSDGIGGSFGVGMGLNYNFKPNIAFYTGLEFNFESFKYSPTAGNHFYYDYDDKEILLNKDDHSTAEGTMEVLSRKQSPITLTIPTMLIFRTNFIGYFRYYGKFGLRTSFVVNQTVTDKGHNHVAENFPAVENGAELEKMKAPNDLLFVRLAAGMALGSEWNFIGSTSLTFEAGFYYAFTPLFSGNGKDDRNSSSLYQYDSGPTRTYRSFKANQMLLEFKVGLLF